MSNKIRVVLLGIMICTLSFVSYSRSIIGIGVGKTERIAKEAALRDLAENISVEVKSDVESFTFQNDEDFNESNSSFLSSKSNHFLTGVKYDISKIKTGYKVKAVLDDESFSIYRDRISELDEEIEELYSYKGSVKTRIDYLNEIEGKLQERKKLEEVLSFVGERSNKNKLVTFEKIKKEKSNLIRKSQVKDRFYISMKGDLKEKERKEILNTVKREINKERIVIVPDDREIEYFVDIEITELEENIIPETAVRPKKYRLTYNCVIFIMNEKTNKEILRTNVSDESEGYDREAAKREMTSKIGKYMAQEIEKVL